MNALNENLKRIFDFTASCGGMVVFSPLYLAIYIAIKCESKGPAIFRQERIGRGGKAFTLYKFRSMKVTSESDGKPALCQHGDARLTRVGKFIREHHLDELPQLWNVAKGDMSFVGPRPERQYYIDKIMEVNPEYERLYELRPGLFSYATLHNGYTDTLEKMLKRLEYDLEYLENRTMAMDTKIIFQTVWSILSGKKF
ncbi:MAG: sugar transferase [Candidatus Cryptobacteroides sp.]|nr:sugar transferase [Alistipes sp.]MDY3834783.1 sugar transferase [Candidatus Cryptobacteroides sp.]MDY4563327.1 sugar transferase [Candidatus Cryptobacteroides sp.]